MQKDNALENAYAELRPFFQNKLKGRILYHYTTLSTFDAFLKDDAQLVCTHYAALNDSSEMTCGFDMICDYLQRICGVARITCQQLKECFVEGKSTEMIKPTWIMSFSLEEDSLYQWGMYTERKQGGYSVGFNSNELNNLVDDSNQRNETTGSPPFTMKLIPCLYTETDKDRIETFLSIAFNQADDALSRLKTNGFNDPDAAMTILARMVLVSCLIKHDSFKYEDEVRLVVDPTYSSFGDVSLIGGKPRWKTGLFPHAGTPLRSAFKEVWISPHGDKQLLKDVAEMMNKKYGLNYVTKTSRSPYNGR